MRGGVRDRCGDEDQGRGESTVNSERIVRVMDTSCRILSRRVRDRKLRRSRVFHGSSIDPRRGCGRRLSPLSCRAGAVLRRTSDPGAHAAGRAGAKGASSPRDAGRVLPFPAGRRERESRCRRPERSTTMTSAEVLQAPRPRAHGEDRRELHGGARGAAGRARAQGHRRSGALDVRRGDPARGPDGDGRSGSTSSTPGAPPSERTRRSRAGSPRSTAIDGWDAQAVTVSYERARGGGAVGEHADGFTITASKTVAVPVDGSTRRSSTGRARRDGCPNGGLRERTALKPQVGPFRLGRR